LDFLSLQTLHLLLGYTFSEYKLLNCNAEVSQLTEILH